MELIRRFSHESFERALESWSWLPGLSEKTPTFSSPFGDVFLHAADGSYWFLDLLEGSLNPCAGSARDLQETLDTRAGQEKYLLAGLVEAAGRRGLGAGPDDVFSFIVAPVLGGDFAVENVEISGFVVAVNLAGQLHDQLKDLPAGTPITGAVFEGE